MWVAGLSPLVGDAASPTICYSGSKKGTGPRFYLGSGATERKNITDTTQARYVELRQDDGVFTIALYDQERRPVGHGYRGPTLKRAEQDFKYWQRDKGLEKLPE